ncbi:MAG: PAS domain-containing protein [ANME-2 cluster archaeon]|nr:PAS domain-containing protein [ANME-2 cluster archaeon]
MNVAPEDVLQYIEKELGISSPDPWILFDREGTIADVNEATVRLTGKKRIELIGTPFADHFTDPGKANNGVKLVFETGELHDYDLALTCPDGTRTIIACNASVFKDRTGQATGAFAVGRDVTVLKTDHQRLRETITRIHHKYRHIQSELSNAESDCNKAKRELQETVNRLEAYTGRINNMIVTMLKEITHKECSVVILDITGLQEDVEVSDHLVTIAQSARQLGATCIVTGVKSDVVDKLTDLGVTLSPLSTEQSLKNGLRYTIAIIEKS